jgi:hypothetical protein
VINAAAPRNRDGEDVAAPAMPPAGNGQHQMKDRVMHSFTRIAAAALLIASGVAGLSGGAWSSGIPAPGAANYNDDAVVSPGAKIFGGALYRTTGSGESAVTEATAVFHVQPGRLIARTVTNGDDVQVIYQDELPVQQFAQRAR